MRSAFQTRLTAIETDLEDALHQAAHTFSHLDEAVLAPTPVAVDVLARAGDRLREITRRADLELVNLIALQAPVACDLRLVLTMIQIAQHGGLIANQLTLIGEQLAEIDPDVPDLCRTGETVASMARVACEQLTGAAAAFAERDAERVHRLEADDDVLDELNRQVCRVALEVSVPAPQRELAFRHILIARSLERVGDNAVRIAAHTAVLVQGDVHHLAGGGAAAVSGNAA